MKDLLAEVMIRFDELYPRAMESGLRDANAMTVSTVVGANARPSSRMVLLKAHDARGFVFFWRGIENRLHERTPYWEDEGRWRTVLLYP